MASTLTSISIHSKASLGMWESERGGKKRRERMEGKKQTKKNNLATKSTK
jgi:hypothetical protein